MPSSGTTPAAAAALAINGGPPVTTTPVPFMSPVVTEADVEAALQVLKSGMLRQAARCEELEQRMAAMSGATHAMTCANGTCALQLAYGATIKAGDEVIVPAWTYIATASMIAAAGATPVFCDVHEDTMNIDVEDAAARITPRTTAIACTHLYGNPVDIDAVEALAARHGLAVIYDAAQSICATYKGKGIGAFGSAVTYSFYATKNLATGEGGMVTTNDDALARQIKLLRSHGETDKYIHEQVGFNYRMTDVEAAIGCSQMDRIADLTAKRQAAARRLDQIVGNIDGLVPPRTTEGGEHVYHLYTVKFEADKFTCTRDEFVEALRAEGVQCAVHYPRSLTRQPAFKQWIKDHPAVADGLSGKVFCLPVHPGLTEAHFVAIEEALNKLANHYHA